LWKKSLSFVEKSGKKKTGEIKEKKGALATLGKKKEEE